jgi:SAM-dependent methyltransferase
MSQDVFGEFSAASLAGTDQEVEFIKAALNLPACSKILDLYCGYGRHAIELAKSGYAVTGVDNTADFLSIAKQKAAELEVSIDFCQCDMREIHFYNHFDAVINMFAAFGYFNDDENSAVMGAISRSLKPKGLFLIDLLNREWMQKNNLNRYWRHPNGESVVSTKVEIYEGLAMMKRQLINQVTGQKMETDFQLRTYSLAEMTELLSFHHLQIKKVYGAFDGRTYDEDTPRMIILAQKMNE